MPSSELCIHPTERERDQSEEREGERGNNVVMKVNNSSILKEDGGDPMVPR
jgi:hypothetical protein